MKLLTNNNLTRHFTNLVQDSDTIMDINASDCTRMSMQMLSTDVAGSPLDFIDGVLASGTITITNFALAAGTIVTVAGHALVEGVNWTAATSNNATADSLQAAIDALTEVQAANPPAAIITVKSISVGTAGNAITTTVVGTGVTVQQAHLAGGLNSAVNGTEFTILAPGTNFATGLAVTYDVVTGTTLDNLVDTTMYYVIRVDADHIALAETQDDADNDVRIEIADASDAIGGGEFTLTPNNSGSVTYSYYASNDGEVFTQFDPVTVYTDGANTLVLLGDLLFLYYRLVIQVTAGEADVDVTLFGQGVY